jgi:hypothetical protein
MHDLGWVLLAVVVYVAGLKWLASSKPTYQTPEWPQPRPMLPRHREYEERWATYLKELQAQNPDNRPGYNPPELAMSMFASKADYDAAMALRQSKQVH